VAGLQAAQLKRSQAGAWKALKDQHGVGFAKLYHFKSKFPTVLALAMSVYPEAKVDVRDDGIVLHPSPPPVRPRLVRPYVATATDLSIQHAKTRPYGHRIISSATQPPTY
jgi:hypothetical protein